MAQNEGSAPIRQPSSEKQIPRWDEGISLSVDPDFLLTSP